MKKHLPKYYFLFLLALVFAAPGITAYVFYQHPTWLSAAKVNKGNLLEHPIELSSLGTQSKWRIVFHNSGACQEQCLQRLDLLARVRLALGRKLYQVDQWLIVDSPNTVSAELQQRLKEQDFHLGTWSEKDKEALTTVPADVSVFLVDPQQYIILTYPNSLKPEDLYKDLKYLLNTEHKSG